MLVFNGEIYNHQDIRLELEAAGVTRWWRGSSDTETLLVALSHWGIERCLPKLIGMFAFALWDKSKKALYLARDRMGEKPLYYGHSHFAFLFGSELKALLVHPAWQGEINRDVVALYLRFGYVPSPWSIYRDIFKLPPAHMVTITDGGRTIGQPVCYWSLNQLAGKESDPISKTPEALTDELEALLRDSVKRQMASDVPMGAFLSGGYDSSTVAALMQTQSDRPIRTFSIGFEEARFDESIYARQVAKHLGTEHSEFYATPQEALEVIPRMPVVYDEPFSDVSQIPTYLVSKFARRHVTVSLSGDGGDELFCGYNRYGSGYRVWQKLRMLPQPARQVLIGLIDRAPGETLDRLQGWLPRRLQVSSLAGRLPKLASALRHRDGLSYYKALVSHVENPHLIALGSTEPETLNKINQTGLKGLQDQMMLWDMATYLPDDILTKVDRASMAVSLEVRVPLLDHRLVEFAWSIPTNLKYKNGVGKWLLRQVLHRYVPKELMERPKMGFGVPIEHWLRGSLRDWAESLLTEGRMSQEGYLNPLPIRQMWREHLSGKRNWQYQLWDVLMFQAWLREQLR